MSDTPETDAEQKQLNDVFEARGTNAKTAGYAYAAMTYHARQLERRCLALEALAREGHYGWKNPFSGRKTIGETSKQYVERRIHEIKTKHAWQAPYALVQTWAFVVRLRLPEWLPCKMLTKSQTCSNAKPPA